MSGLSTTTSVSGACSSTPSSRPIFSGPTTSVVMRIFADARRRHHLGLADLGAAVPTAPAEIWRRAISGSCASRMRRSFLPRRLTYAPSCDVTLEAVEVEQERGVGSSFRVMAWRAYHGSLYHRRHDDITFVLLEKWIGPGKTPACT